MNHHATYYTALFKYTKICYPNMERIYLTSFQLPVKTTHDAMQLHFKYKCVLADIKLGCSNNQRIVFHQILASKYWGVLNDITNPFILGIPFQIFCNFLKPFNYDR